ncbi:MAG: DUF2764 domain-containing protein [Deltaproteobacteria bacterium]|nr:DUF2764 domain-containing protein [Deltaproteobacteria bacterium]
MMRQPYYTLLAGLPPLPRFDRAERLPISWERLQQRLRMLNSHDAQVLERATAFLTRQKDAQRVTDSELVGRFWKMAETMSNSRLNGLFSFPVDQRTIMAALRRRHQGLNRPSGKESWGAGQYVGHIERNWDAPHFRLAKRYPWLPQAKLYLEDDSVLDLDRLLKNVLWDYLDGLVPDWDFGFRAVMAYRMKWEMVDQWLTHDVAKAGERFNELVKEIIHEQTKLFH